MLNITLLGFFRVLEPVFPFFSVSVPVLQVFEGATKVSVFHFFGSQQGLGFSIFLGSH